MANPAPSGTDDYNTTIIEEFRANGTPARPPQNQARA